MICDQGRYTLNSSDYMYTSHTTQHRDQSTRRSSHDRFSHIHLSNHSQTLDYHTAHIVRFFKNSTLCSSNASKQKIGQRSRRHCVSIRSSAPSKVRLISYDKSTPRCRSICRAARLRVGRIPSRIGYENYDPLNDNRTDVLRPMTLHQCRVPLLIVKWGLYVSVSFSS